MKKLRAFLVLSIFLSTLTADSAHYSKAELNLDNRYDLFEGDWFNDWEDPKDSRFLEAKIDLKEKFAKATPLREELFTLRQKYIRLFNALDGDPKADYLGLSKELSKEYITFTNKFIKKALPENVSEEDMAFMGFGSMAREESGIVTDLEGTLLWSPHVKSKQTLGYIFGQKLSNRLDGLLGHPIYGIKGFRLDEAEHSPFHRAPWAANFSTAKAYCMGVKSLPVTDAERDLNKFRNSYFYPFEGSWVYTSSTPEELAYLVNAAYIDNWPNQFLLQINEKTKKSDWYQWAEPLVTSRFIKESYIADVLASSDCVAEMQADEIAKTAKELSERLKKTEIATISNFPQISRNHIYVYGNKKLVDEFNARRNEILNKDNQFLRKKLANKFLKELITFILSQTGDSFITGKAPGVVDIKRYNYRLDEQIHTNFALLFGIEKQNQADIIKELVEKGFFGKEYGRATLERVNQEVRLRWRKQIKLQSQLSKDMQFLTKEAYDKKLAEMRADLKANEETLNKAEASEIEILQAKNTINELKQDLKLMAKSMPGKDDSIFRPQEIEYIRDVLYPEQALVMKRLVAYVGRSADPEIAPNPDAFKDSFDPSNIKISDYIDIKSLQDD